MVAHERNFPGPNLDLTITTIASLSQRQGGRVPRYTETVAQLTDTWMSGCCREPDFSLSAASTIGEEIWALMTVLTNQKGKSVSAIVSQELWLPKRAFEDSSLSEGLYVFHKNKVDMALAESGQASLFISKQSVFLCSPSGLANVTPVLVCQVSCL